MEQDSELKLFEDKKIRARWTRKMVFFGCRCSSSINR